MFEILKGGKVFMHTSSEDCLYPPDAIQSMIEAGFTFRKYGKPWRPPVKKGRKKNKEGE